MNWVEKLDQNIVYYPFIRKSHKWSKKFVVYLFEISLFNAFVLYKTEAPHGKCSTLLSFVQSVVNSRTSQEPVRRADGPETNAGIRDAPLAQKTQRAPYKTDPRKRLDADFAAPSTCPHPANTEETAPNQVLCICFCWKWTIFILCLLLINTINILY